ncbi:MAG: AAA family ATPase, partial [Pseudonocardia sp.]|nr:AAA family ATPase [Pseudonocardia sp.]
MPGRHGHHADAPTIGRDAELATVNRFLDAVADGPSALLVEGVAGIGKTTLWRAAVTTARARGYQVLAATAVDTEADLPFVGLRDLAAPVAADTAAGLPEVQQAALSRALLSSGESGGPADLHAVCAAALGVVRVLSRSVPLVVAIDDVTWMDRSSQRVLRYVGRRLNDERMGILLARRSGEPSPPPGLDGPAVQATAVSIELDTLSADDLHLLLTGHGLALSRRTTGHIHRVSGGNPFYAVEIGRAVVRDGRRPVGENALPVPGGVLTVTAQRVANLSPSARQAVGVVALMSTPTVEQVGAVVGPEVGAAVEEAVGEGLLDDDAPGLRFAHPILRSAVSAGLTTSGRRELHRRIAAAVADPDEQVLHLAAAASGP